jgi:CDP-6-deoxy-D-xylo-4-hexulose-3-dehydrase
MDNLLKLIKQHVQQYCDANFKFDFNPANPKVRLHETSFGADEINAMIAQSLSTMVTMGDKVKQFEKQCAGRFGVEYSIMNNSGSSANLLAIALSWATTIWPLIQHQLIPVFVDCDPMTLNFESTKLEAAISTKTRAIMPVHVYGNPCDMGFIMALATKHNLYVIEDTCEAMGATFDGKQVGSFGDIGTMSLYYSHHITTFEGGLCFTNNFELAELVRVLRAHGWSREVEEKEKYISKYPDIDSRFIFINLGYNLRPTEVQASMGLEQLPKLDGFIEARRKAYAYYRKGLDKYSEFFGFQEEQKNSIASWFGFCITLTENAPFSRKDITNFLHAKQIETRPIIAGNMAKHPALTMYTHRVAGTLESADSVMARGFAIGCHQAIDQKACAYVIECMDAFMESQGLRSVA